MAWQASKSLRTDFAWMPWNERSGRAKSTGWASWFITQIVVCNIRRFATRSRGTEVDRTGDGFLATFDGPARAVCCAREIADEVRELGIEVRAGCHMGEIEVVDGGVRGIAVHIGTRVMDLARPSEVLVSSTVKDLVGGSGLSFEERGTHSLKGVPGE